ncbi:MAG TPA: hypothetical protein DHV84_06155 [Desulfotomaculum sp.]|nr:hypothetical protein [Desulfotomaculum sp.]
MSEQREKKSRFGGLLGLDPTLGLGDKIIDHFDDEKEKAAQMEGKDSYYARCPQCNKKQVRQNLITTGCFACNWKGSEAEIELSRVKNLDGRAQPVDCTGESYHTSCPDCGARVISSEFKENGCYRCGYKG